MLVRGNYGEADQYERAYGFREIAVIERRRVCSSFNGGIMYDFVECICCDSWSNMRSSDIEDFTRYLIFHAQP